jgi:hypothetical protein
MIRAHLKEELQTSSILIFRHRSRVKSKQSILERIHSIVFLKELTNLTLEDL